MKVLVIGSGGREHAIAWKISQSPLVETVFCAPGNAGTFLEHKCRNIALNSIEELKNFAVEQGMDITIVGPEMPLVMGIVDEFQSQGLKIFGPPRDAARLEGSKAFSKEFMKKYGVKTAGYAVFDDGENALKYLRTSSYPIVVKADGLAAGKGVAICMNYDEAERAIREFMIEDIFKGSGLRVVIEEYLVGIEASILAITDGNTIIPFAPAMDHKSIFDGGTGPNTGGMGVIAPNPVISEEFYKAFESDILSPTLMGLKNEGLTFSGIIFFGVMVTEDGIYCLEYNVRMGDPETQAILPLMESDFVQLVEDSLNGKLDKNSIKWSNKTACCVVAASDGYPGKFETGFEISGINDVDGKVFISGAAGEGARLTTSGGRVLSVVALGETIESARKKVYEEIQKVNFNGIYYRRDIGKSLVVGTEKGC